MAAVLAVALSPAGTAFSETIKFEVELSGANEVPPNDATGSATAEMTYDTTSRTLEWSVTYHDLTGPLIGVHIHGPGDSNSNAGILTGLDSIDQNPIIGSIELTESQADELMDGFYYFNLHTDAHRGGEVRGQIEPEND